MSDWTAGDWSAAATVAAAVIYVFLGIFAFVQLLQNRKLRQLETRPYVIVDFDTRRELIYVAISNVGRTPARDVVIKFTEPLRTTGQMRSDPSMAAVFNSPIPMLAPGRVIRIAFGLGFEILNDDSIPHSYEVSVSYTDLERKNKFADPSYVMDLAHLRDAALGPKGLSELVDKVSDVGKQLQRWTKDSGLMVYTRDRKEYLTEQREWMETERERRAQQAQESDDAG
jgi:hypothetical protein